MLRRCCPRFVPQQRPNKVTVVFSSLTERTSWPLWKVAQLQQATSALDVSLLAFTHAHGALEAHITKDSPTGRSTLQIQQLLPVNTVEGHPDRFCRDTLQSFIHRSFDPSRPNYFVYGGHGMGDYFDVEEGHTVMQVHELARMMGSLRYQGLLFDACCMANLDCVYHFRLHANFIGACQGYLWEDDTSVGAHVLNNDTVTALSNPASAGVEGAFRCLKAVESEFMTRTCQGDFAVLDPTNVEQLYDITMLEVAPRLYKDGWTLPFHALRNPQLPARISTRAELSEFVRFHHSFFPSNAEDRHLIDLKGCLEDMLANETIERNGRRIVSSDIETAIELCRSIVRSHSAPKDPATYAVPMNGLSFAAHEVSNYSQPIVPPHHLARYRPGVYTQDLLHTVNSVLAHGPNADLLEHSDVRVPSAERTSAAARAFAFAPYASGH